jgi:D-3-phosphoglycerate dehydrogenase
LTSQPVQPAVTRPENLLVVVPDDFPPVFADSAALMRLRRRAHLEIRVFTSRPRDEADLIERTSEAHTILGIRSSTRFTHAVIEAATRLKHIALWGTAVDNVALDAARRAGVAVSSTPQTATTTVAEHALALALALARRVPELDARIREGDWPGGRITQLAGKTMGVVGTGAVGMRLAELAHGIGMEVLLCPMHGDEDTKAESERAPWARVVGLEELLRASDVVSAHARLSPQTEHLFSTDEFALMKPTALFVNTARGRLVDEVALAEALRNDTIDGAALDVFEHEPLPQQSPLRHLPNVILSPHTAAAANEALNAGLNMAVDNVIAFLEARPMRRVT